MSFEEFEEKYFGGNYADFSKEYRPEDDSDEARYHARKTYWPCRKCGKSGHNIVPKGGKYYAVCPHCGHVLAEGYTQRGADMEYDRRYGRDA